MSLWFWLAFLCILMMKRENEVTQSCPTLCNPMDCSPPGSSVHGDSPGNNTGVGCYFLLQGIFLTQELNPGLPRCRQTLPSESPGKPILMMLSIFSCTCWSSLRLLGKNVYWSSNWSSSQFFLFNFEKCVLLSSCTFVPYQM